jgi:hypothetical protein
LCGPRFISSRHLTDIRRAWSCAAQPSNCRSRPTDAFGKLYVSDSIIEHNGGDPGSGGIVIAPRGVGSARVVIDRTQVKENKFGIFASGADTSQLSVVQIRDTTVTGSFFDGITATTVAGQGTVSITVDRSASILNGFGGIEANGPRSFVLLGSSTVMSNVMGLHAHSVGHAGCIRGISRPDFSSVTDLTV